MGDVSISKNILRMDVGGTFSCLLYKKKGRISYLSRGCVGRVRRQEVSGHSDGQVVKVERQQLGA